MRHCRVHVVPSPVICAAYKPDPIVPEKNDVALTVATKYHFLMGPLALISEELRAGRLLAPINEPALRTRGYFVYALEASRDAPAVAALRKWLVAAGSLAETEFATYLSANPS
jgi:hypothetical protein